MLRALPKSFAITVLAAILPVAPLAAQRPTPAEPPPAANSLATNQVTEFKGKLLGMRGNLLMVAREDEKEVLVQMPDEVTGLTFVAEAEPEFLRRGMAIRFESEFAPNGIPTAPVEKFEVFQPIQSRQMSRAVRERFVPGIYPREEQPAAQPGPASYRVVGNVVGLDPSGVMLVQAGPRRLRVQLAAEPEIEVRFNNLTLAQPDDTVSVAGFYQPPDESRVKADRITVTTERVFGKQEELGARRDETAAGAAENRRSRRSRRTATEGDRSAESPRN